MRSATSLLSLAALLLPASAYAASPRTFADLANMVVTFLDSAAGLLIVAGIAIYFYGVSTNLLKMSSEGGRKAREYLVWGLIVIFVMVSIWGILEVLQNTLFGGNRFSPNSGEDGGPPPSFQPPAFVNE